MSPDRFDVVSLGSKSRLVFDAVPKLRFAPLIAGLVRVLLVRMSVVALPTSVSVDVGSVSVPVFEIVEMIGAVSV